ncbi:EamA family transporter [Thiovibrio frasassiensis]|uniref:EamA family transporter n=1 Tax=Thiovibrio frasassiensis TaxID=2984131 RepID=A0A9X4MGF3_9BACT|nr:EamA family transporter [Thiovibrio frasassiensis]MDG4475063.1 EamA family transporter [Thiovibrio frasassiensis]
MESWLIPAFTALIIYGLWGFFPKLAVSYINPASALVFEVAGAMLVGLSALLWVGFQPETHPKGILFAVLTGVAGMLGTLFFFIAASRGKISVVVSMTALYPIITIIIAAIFLREPVTAKQVMGMVCAVTAIFLLTS